MSQAFWPIFSILEENKKKTPPPPKKKLTSSTTIEFRFSFIKLKLKLYRVCKSESGIVLKTLKKFLLKILKTDGQNCKNKYLLFKYGEYRL